MRTLSALIATLLLVGCTPEIGQQPEQPPPGTIEERLFTVTAPGYDPPWIEFATRDHGYALFTKCGGGTCEALLFSTDDGARSWKGRKHPQPAAKNQQMYVVDADTVVLWSEPETYVSDDGAVSWRKHAGEYRIGDGGRFHVDDAGVIRDRDDPRARWQAPDGATWLTNTTPGGTLWLAGRRGGAPLTWASSSGPDGFRPVEVPKQVGRPVYAARVMVSADGVDTWLVADQEPVSGGGRSALARGSVLKGTGLPLIWQLRNGSWEPVSTAGIEEKPNWPYSVAPAGGGLLVVSGPDHLVYLRDGGVTTAPDPELGWVAQLRDGTVFGRLPTGEAVYLAADAGATRWIKVVLSHH